MCRQRRFVVSYRCFGTTYRSHPQDLEDGAHSLSRNVGSYQSTLRTLPRRVKISRILRRYPEIARYLASGMYGYMDSCNVYLSVRFVYGQLVCSVLDGLLICQSYLMHRTLPVDASVGVSLADCLIDKQTPGVPIMFC